MKHEAEVKYYMFQAIRIERELRNDWSNTTPNYEQIEQRLFERFQEEEKKNQVTIQNFGKCEAMKRHLKSYQKYLENYKNDQCIKSKPRMLRRLLD